MRHFYYSALQRLMLFVLMISFALSSQAREVITLQTGWKFAKGSNDKAFEMSFDDSKWQSVSVPHDWAISEATLVDGDGNTGKLPWKGEGWYRRKLDINAATVGKHIYLVFDGVMSSPEVYVNGKFAGKWDYGYNSFYVDITNLVQSGGDNILAVHADTRNHDSRWYPGAGIYRKVQMVVVDPIHVGVWGTQVTTPVVKANYADVRVMTTVLNKSANKESKIKVTNIVISPNGQEVAWSESTSAIAAGASKEIETNMNLSNPQRWELDKPVLYQIKTNIYRDGKIVDTYITPFGVRTLRFTASNGLYLNDKRVQIKGVNLHQDQGPLGSAFYPRAMERQIEIMKSMGCNAIRTSHNPSAPELLELCDKMGVLVFNEAFDKYDGKIDINENTDFEEYAARNIANFVKRDRNHPCVFIWSVGNEMGDVQWNINNGFHRLQTMINYVRKFDPTRAVTMVCDNEKSATTRHFDFYDVHCWNYGRRYKSARQMEPGKSVIISESASTVSTRGFYEMPYSAKKDSFSNSLQVSSYDLNAPEWAEIPDDDFMWQQDEEYVAGEFVWTGFDYIGEPTPYENGNMKMRGMTDKNASRTSYFGIVDLCGIPKDRYYLYKSYWKQDENTVHILPHWNWDASKVSKLPVFVYTNGDKAELFLNGKSLGFQSKKQNSTNSTERFRLMWPNVTYEAGELKAVAYKEGKVIGESVVKTAGDPYEIRVTPDRTKIAANGMDLSYLLVEAYDKNGNLCPLASNKIKIDISGPAHLAGVGNGNPQCFDSFQSNEISLFYGKAMVILASDLQKGEVKITLSTQGLNKVTKTIRVE